MKLTKPQRTRLGAFIVAGAVLLGTAVFALIGSSWFRKVDVYKVRFTESVSGLEVSSQVKYQGLRVGKVQSLAVAPDDPRAIVVQLALAPGTPLYEGTIARLDTSALTGMTTINLTPGDPRGKLLSSGSSLQAGMSFTDRITGEAEVIRNKLETLTNQLTRWTSDANRRRFERLLDDSDALVRHLDATIVELRPKASLTLDGLQRASGGATRLADEGTRTLVDAQRTLRTLQQRTSETLTIANKTLQSLDGSQLGPTLQSAQGVIQQLSKVVGQLDVSDTMKNAETTLRTLASVAVRLRHFITTLQTALKAGRVDTLKALRNFKEATEDIKGLSRDLARDPSLVIRGRGKRK